MPFLPSIDTEPTSVPSMKPTAQFPAVTTALPSFFVAVQRLLSLKASCPIRVTVAGMLDPLCAVP